MRRQIVFFSLVAIVTLGLVCICSPADGQDQPVRTRYVKLANGVPGVLYEPDAPGKKAHIALFVMHAAGDYLTFSACTELSKRGYRVLCANNSTSKSGGDDGDLYRIMLEVKAGITYLRNYSGVDKIVLFGHSGGATVMTAYEDIAENGVGVCKHREILAKCPDELAGMPHADGVVLADANWGQAEMVLLSIDPSVINEQSGMATNPDLDLYSPRNGFDPNGSTYSQDFIHRFQTAEGKRMNSLIMIAQTRVADIEAGKGRFLDDEPFVVPGGSGFAGANKLFPQDLRLLSHSQKPWPLLHADGSVTTEIIHCVRVPEGTHSSTPYFRGALKTTVRNFLSTWAVRVTDDYSYDEESIHGVDWTSTMASPPGDVEGIAVPFLTMGMTGHWEGLAAETIYDHAKSDDKTIAFVEGAQHDYTPCTKCEKTSGQFGDTLKTTYDYIDGWLNKKGRFD
jgi:hypothetical protein